MRDNTVEVVEGELRFAPRFNVAVPFIDRHLEEGRGGKVAIRAASGEEVTYARLADRVDRGQPFSRNGAALLSFSGERERGREDSIAETRRRGEREKRMLEVRLG